MHNDTVSLEEYAKSVYFCIWDKIAQLTSISVDERIEQRKKLDLAKTKVHNFRHYNSSPDYDEISILEENDVLEKYQLINNKDLNDAKSICIDYVQHIATTPLNDIVFCRRNDASRMFCLHELQRIVNKETLTNLILPYNILPSFFNIKEFSEKEYFYTNKNTNNEKFITLCMPYFYLIRMLLITKYIIAILNYGEIRTESNFPESDVKSKLEYFETVLNTFKLN